MSMWNVESLIKKYDLFARPHISNCIGSRNTSRIRSKDYTKEQPRPQQAGATTARGHQPEEKPLVPPTTAQITSKQPADNDFNLSSIKNAENV
jgi:hypothetical protein